MIELNTFRNAAMAVSSSLDNQVAVSVDRTGRDLTINTLAGMQRSVSSIGQDSDQAAMNALARSQLLSAVRENLGTSNAAKEFFSNLEERLLGVHSGHIEIAETPLSMREVRQTLASFDKFKVHEPMAEMREAIGDKPTVSAPRSKEVPTGSSIKSVDNIFQANANVKAQAEKLTQIKADFKGALDQFQGILSTAKLDEAHKSTALLRLIQTNTVFNNQLSKLEKGGLDAQGVKTLEQFVSDFNDRIGDFIDRAAVDAESAVFESPKFALSEKAAKASGPAKFAKIDSVGLNAGEVNDVHDAEAEQAAKLKASNEKAAAEMKIRREIKLELMGVNGDKIFNEAVTKLANENFAKSMVLFGQQDSTAKAMYGSILQNEIRTLQGNATFKTEFLKASYEDRLAERTGGTVENKARSVGTKIGTAFMGNILPQIQLMTTTRTEMQRVLGKKSLNAESVRVDNLLAFDPVKKQIKLSFGCLNGILQSMGQQRIDTKTAAAAAKGKKPDIGMADEALVNVHDVGLSQKDGIFYAGLKTKCHVPLFGTKEPELHIPLSMKVVDGNRLQIGIRKLTNKHIKVLAGANWAIAKAANGALEDMNETEINNSSSVFVRVPVPKEDLDEESIRYEIDFAALAKQTGVPSLGNVSDFKLDQAGNLIFNLAKA